jgi:heat shock protein HtpX
MADNLHAYEEHSANWRASTRRNSRKTYITIGTFFLIYGCLGLLVDTYMVSAHYPLVPLSTIVTHLLTLQPFPIATSTLLVVAGIALWVTFAFHDKLMLLGTESREITHETAGNLEEQRLYNVIDELRIAAGLKFMPKVYIIDANYMNAFASGYSEKSSLVAITSGLLAKLDRSELQAVMAHEISHIRNMDIKLTLMASVLANIMLIVIDFFFYSIVFGGRNREKSNNQLFLIIMILRYTLPLITILLTLYLSRTREYMADAGCVELTRDNQPLAHALLKIQADTQANADSISQEYAATPHEDVRRSAYIYDPAKAGISAQSLSGLFSTHPSIEKRLEAIGFKKRNS